MHLIGNFWFIYSLLNKLKISTHPLSPFYEFEAKRYQMTAEDLILDLIAEFFQKLLL